MNKGSLDADIHRIIDERKHEIARTLSELVRIPSRTGEEGPAQEYVKKLYDSLGADVRSFEANDGKIRKHSRLPPSLFSFKGRPNVVAVLKGKPSARSLILNGHVDVVPVEPESSWSASPWSGKIKGDRLYGRGSCDMKAGLIINYYALKCLLDAGLTPEGTLTLESVIEEESQGGGGTLACLIEGYTADGTVVTEPSGETVELAASGVHWFRVKVKGNPAHASMAQAGANAIYKMNRLCDVIRQLGETRARENHHPLIERSAGRSCTLNIGRYRAGDWPSTVAAWAELDCRIGHVPGEKTEHVRQQVEDTISRAADADEWLKDHHPEIEWFGIQSEPWEQDPDHPLVKEFLSCARRVLRRPIAISGSTACTDTQHMPNFKQPALVFGPSGGNIHGLDEYVNLSSVINCTRTVASFIADWCGVRS